MQIAQLPTPTPYIFPDSTPVFNLDPADFSLWASTGDVINFWNYEPNLGLVIQWSIIVIIVVSFTTLLYRLIQGTIECEQ